MAEKSNAGRPTKFDESQLPIISKLCELGATDKDLADALNVHISTINQWKLDFQQFSDTLKEGKKLANSLVEQSLFKRAIGAKVKEEKVFNNQGEIITHDTVKEFPPETGACMAWLKNRDRENWREQDQVNVVVNNSLADIVNSAADDD